MIWIHNIQTLSKQEVAYSSQEAITWESIIQGHNHTKTEEITSPSELILQPRNETQISSPMKIPKWQKFLKNGSNNNNKYSITI